jgi:hypothetical protein
VNCYQLSCGHWQSGEPGHEIGGILSCTRCNALRTTIIGMSTGILQVAPS